MRDLHRCLYECSPELLRVIGDAWQLSLAKGEPREMALRLAEAMLAPNAVEGVLEALSSHAREALATLVREGGALPGQRLSLRYGSIRRFGPARMEREEPWLHPENALEELYYRGIVHRAYGSIGEYYGEVFLIPQQLLERVPELQEAPESEIEEVGTPTLVKSDGLALIEDLLAILVHMRQHRAAAPDSSPGSEPLSSVPSYLDLESRLLGGNNPERLALAWRLLWGLRLVGESHGMVEPSLRAREWLRLSDSKRLRSVYLAWRDDPRWDELHLLPSLQCEDTGWQSNPVAARRNLLYAMGKLPRNAWVSLDSLIQTLKRCYPDYLRPDGDFESWYIRDSCTGEYLTGFESWDKIEGALARYIITRPLAWLGIVDTGQAEKDEEPSAVRITERGWHLLGREEESSPPDDSTAEHLPLATVGDDLVATISLVDSAYERYQLERFAEWEAQKTEATYRITPESVWRSQNADIKIEQILSFLKRITQDSLPPAVTRTLLAWRGRFGRACIRKTVLLQTVDERAMEQIRGQPELRALLGEELSPTKCLVEEEHLEELIERLKSLGIWPRVEP